MAVYSIKEVIACCTQETLSLINPKQQPLAAQVLTCLNDLAEQKPSADIQLSELFNTDGLQDNQIQFIRHTNGLSIDFQSYPSPDKALEAIQRLANDVNSGLVKLLATTETTKRNQLLANFVQTIKVSDDEKELQEISQSIGNNYRKPIN